MVEYWPISRKTINCNGPDGRFKTPVPVDLELSYVKKLLWDIFL